MTENTNPADAATKKAVSTPRRMSAFRSSKHFAAGRFLWVDTTFFYREMTDPLRERLQESMQRVHEWLGVSLEEAQTNVRAFEGVDPEKMEQYPAKVESAYNEILAELLIDWDDPDVPFDAQHIPHLGLECKTALLNQIAVSTQSGESQSFTPGRLKR